MIKNCNDMGVVTGEVKGAIYGQYIQVIHSGQKAWCIIDGTKKI